MQTQSLKVSQGRACIGPCCAPVHCSLKLPRLITLQLYPEPNYQAFVALL